MPRKLRVVRRTLRRPGRIVPAAAARLHGRLVILGPGQSMAWHSTGPREEVVIMIAGTARLEWLQAARLRRATLAAWHSAFLPRHTTHRVVNRSRRPARYLYLTG